MHFTINQLVILIGAMSQLDTALGVPVDLSVVDNAALATRDTISLTPGQAPSNPQDKLLTKRMVVEVPVAKSAPPSRQGTGTSLDEASTVKLHQEPNAVPPQAQNAVPHLEANTVPHPDPNPVPHQESGTPGKQESGTGKQESSTTPKQATNTPSKQGPTEEEIATYLRTTNDQLDTSAIGKLLKEDGNEGLGMPREVKYFETLRRSGQIGRLRHGWMVSEEKIEKLLRDQAKVALRTNTSPAEGSA